MDLNAQTTTRHTNVAQKSRLTNAHYLLLIVPLLLLAFGLRAHRFARLGTQADEGMHFTIGERLVAGDVLYRDLFENHTPGVDWLLAAAFKVTGANLLVGRFLAVGAATLTVAGLIAAGRQLDFAQPRRANGKKATPWAGLLAALLFASAPLPIFWSRFVTQESFETAFAVLSIACVLRGLKKGTRRWWLFAGGMAGLALLIKVSGLILVGTLGLFVSIWWLKERNRRPVQAGLFIAAGFVLALLPLGLVLILQRTGDDFFHLLSGVDRLAPLLDWQHKLSILQDWAVKRPFVPLALLGGLLALLARQPAALLLLIWAGAEWIVLLLPTRINFDWGGFSHYALPAVAAASLLAGSSLAWIRGALAARSRPVLALAGLTLLLAGATLPGLAQDLDYVVRETTYPLPDTTAETTAGRALALVTPHQEPVMVFANSIFYHRADRPPASRYFHYPSYLPASSLAAESEAELTAALNSPDVGAVLLSRVHSDRLPQALHNALFEKWTPAAIFPYPYQKDVILYLPRQAPGAAAIESIPYETENADILLTALEVKVLAPTTLLVRLDWSTTSSLDQNYTVFTHLVGPEGALVAQHDSWPVIGFRPTTTWKPGEGIVDWHWLDLPAGVPAGIYELRVGLYDTQTGQRLNVPATGEAERTFVAIHVQL